MKLLSIMIVVQLLWYGIVVVPVAHTLQLPQQRQHQWYDKIRASYVDGRTFPSSTATTTTAFNIRQYPRQQRQLQLQSIQTILTTRLRDSSIKSSSNDNNSYDNNTSLTSSSFTVDTTTEPTNNDNDGFVVAASDVTEIEDLKKELLDYLQLRNEIGADDIAKEQVGKVIGGMKGNKILEFVSVSPNKPSITTVKPNILDYDELTKYGYGHLVTRIMKMGGRNKMYEYMNMDVPAIVPKVVKMAPKIIIDRDDTKRYQGLKLNQILDDNIQGLALERVQKKVELGQRLTASNEDFLNEIDNYVVPFADKRNVGPKQTPDWTVEQIDEWGRQQGRVESWARNAKLGAYVNDPMESFDTINTSQRIYSIVTSFVTAIAFGRATSQLVVWINRSQQGQIVSDDVLSILQIPSTLLLLLALSSGIYCGSQAPSKNRSTFVWSIKGLLGGPFTIEQFSSLSTRQTQQEVLDDQKQSQ